ncbi:hypothetical protein M1116_00790 [Patescibacteria group bacterium]|nr:hypothetical protein [Patescibacteria group bacterium]
MLIILISHSHPDIYNHLDWGNRFLELGPKKFYENSVWSVSWPNQPLASILLFASIAALNKFIFSLFWWLNIHISLFPSLLIPILSNNLHIWLVKTPFIISDIFIGFLIFKIVKSAYPSRAILSASLFLFNPIVIYNSAVWGQTDSLINLLSLSGLYITFRKNYFWGIFLFFLSLLFKLSLIIYLPIFLLIIYHHLSDWKRIILYSLPTIVFIILIALPFSIYSNPVQWLWYLYTNRVLSRQGNMLNGNAFNFWAILKGIDLSLNEGIKYFGVSAKFLSQIFVAILSLIIFLKNISKKLDLKLIFILSFLISFTAFMFLTNMHERYLYPIFPPFCILFGLKSKLFNLKTYFALSAIHLINLYNLWYYPNINFIKLILEYSHYLLPRLLSVLLLILFCRFFIMYLRKEYDKI